MGGFLNIYFIIDNCDRDTNPTLSAICKYMNRLLSVAGFCVIIALFPSLPPSLRESPNVHINLFFISYMVISLL